MQLELACRAAWDDDDASPRWLCNISARLAGIVVNQLILPAAGLFSFLSRVIFAMLNYSNNNNKNSSNNNGS